MSRKGNRGNYKPKVIHPARPAPVLYECPKHGVQVRGAGISWKDTKICFECMIEFFKDNCCELTPVGEKPKAT